MKRLVAGFLVVMPSASLADARDDGAMILHAAGMKKSAHAWKLTAYLHGDADTVRQQLKREIARLAQLYNEKSQSLRETIAELDSDTKRCLRSLRDTVPYKEAADELRQANEEFEQSRSLDIQARLRGSSRLNKAKAVVERLEKRAVANDEEIADDYKRIDLLGQERTDLKRSLLQSLQWRNHLISLTRNTFLLPWPVVGQSGLLGTVRPLSIADHEVVVDAEVYEFISSHATGEGAVQSLVVVHPVRFHIRGLDSSDLQVGKPTCIDLTFRCTGALPENDEGRRQFILERQSDDLDYLFEEIDDLPPNLHKTLEIMGLTPADIQPLPEPLKSADPRNPSDPANKTGDGQR